MVKMVVRGDVGDGVVELVEGLSSVGLSVAGSDGGAVRRDDDVVQRAGIDRQGGSIDESAVVAGDGPGAGLLREIDIGDPAAACGGVYGENGCSGDVGDRVVELVEGLSSIGLGVAGSDGSAVRRDDDVVQRPGADRQAGGIVRRWSRCR